MTVGETYGVYEILEKDETKSQEKHHVYWKCKCLKCNNIVSVRADGLNCLRIVRTVKIIYCIRNLID